jgi:hypothetical protein
MHRPIRIALAVIFVAFVAACATPPAPPTAAARTEVVWLGQSAFKITTPGGKVIVTDPWLRTNPLTPPAYKQLDAFGRIDECSARTAITLMPGAGSIVPPLVQEFHLARKAMAETAPPLNDAALEGFIGAKLLVEGLKRAGDNPSPAKLAADCIIRR